MSYKEFHMFEFCLFVLILICTVCIFLFCIFCILYFSWEANTSISQTLPTLALVDTGDKKLVLSRWCSCIKYWNYQSISLSIIKLSLVLMSSSKTAFLSQYLFSFLLSLTNTQYLLTNTESETNPSNNQMMGRAGLSTSSWLSLLKINNNFFHVLDNDDCASVGRQS